MTWLLYPWTVGFLLSLIASRVLILLEPPGRTEDEMFWPFFLASVFWPVILLAFTLWGIIEGPARLIAFLIQRNKLAAQERAKVEAQTDAILKREGIEL